MQLWGDQPPIPRFATIATHQDSSVREVLQFPVPGGVKDNWQGFMWSLSVAQLHLILPIRRETPSCGQPAAPCWLGTERPEEGGSCQFSVSACCLPLEVGGRGRKPDD
jgi:hypothetical protein